MDRKAQEEIVGFVVIVLIVAVAAVILLGLMGNKKSDIGSESKDLSRFLDSAMEFTTDCTFDNYQANYKSIKDLLRSCYIETGRKCSNEKDVCFVLNQTLGAILENTFIINEDSYNKGYLFQSGYSINATETEKEIVTLSRGNCSSGSYIEGENFFAVDRGTITTTLRVCS